MGKRFGIGALAVAALIVAGPASAQLSAKPAVGTVIGVKSATMLAFQGGDQGYVPPGPGLEFYTFLAMSVVVTSSIVVIQNDSDDPNSP
jgi:hypothetical protein